MFEKHFNSLEALRRPLLEASESSAESQQASAQFVALDGLTRDILRDAIVTEWTSPDGARKEVGIEAGLPRLAAIARSLDPAGVDVHVIDRLEFDFHRRRNDIEHKRRLVSSADALAFAEAIESLLYAITQPPTPELPPPRTDYDGESHVIANHVLARGLQGGRWLARHSQRGQSLGDEHAIELWEHTQGQWRYVETMNLGRQYVVSVQRIQTRSTAQEELLVWRRFGESMGQMCLEVLAFEPGKVMRLLDASGPSMHVWPSGTDLYVDTATRVMRYEWDGTAYVGIRVTRVTPTAIAVRRLHYSVVHGKPIGPDEIELGPGEQFALIRDDYSSAIVRVLYSANGVVDHTKDGTYLATNPGETEITVIPGGYDWGNALRIAVRVTQ